MWKDDKKGKSSKETGDQNLGLHLPGNDKAFSSSVLTTLGKSLTDFNKLSGEEKESQFGKETVTDQFWYYLKKTNPAIFDSLNRNDLPKYLAILEKKGFSIGSLSKDADKLHAEFAPDQPERFVMQDTLENFDKFCKNDANKMPAGIYKKFADEVGFDPESHEISSKGKLRTIDDLYVLWNEFIKKGNIKLDDEQKKNIEALLCPDFNPAERIMVKVAVEKLKKELPNKLKKDFDAKFGSEIDIFSPIATLVDFKRQWLYFLDDNKAEIDEKLAKKLDSVIVTNGDIKKELAKTGGRFDNSQGNGDRERSFRSVFNKLATRQLFSEVKGTKEDLNYYSRMINNTIDGFPPYVNEIFKIYPYQPNVLEAEDTTLHDKLDAVDEEIMVVEEKLRGIQYKKKDFYEKERNRYKEHLTKLKKKKELLKREAYINNLKKKNPRLADVISNVVQNNFDFSKLSIDQQQVLVNVLVEHKLIDLIKHKAPELLDIPEEGLSKFVHELFDLQKKNVTLPTVYGDVDIRFAEKKFLSQKVEKFLSVSELADLQNLPLSFKIIPTDSSEDFFEKGALFSNQFLTFAAKNNPKLRINGGYKVKLTKDGKTVQGYLSQYSPLGEEGEEVANPNLKGSEWYMYTSPVTTPTQERSLVRRGDKKPVLIRRSAESSCSVDVVDRSFSLTGKDIGSLVFGYILGAHPTFKTDISAKEEKKLGGQLEEITRFGKPVLDDEDQSGEITRFGKPVLDDEGQGTEAGQAQATTESSTPEAAESSDKENFLSAWDELKGYRFDGPEYQDNFGFKKGSRLLIKRGETCLPPAQTGGDDRMQLEICDDINRKKGKFSVKIHGGEVGLGKFEGYKKELPINGDTIREIKRIFGDDIYKIPNSSVRDPDQQLELLKKSSFESGFFNYAFDKIRWDGNGYKFALGDFSGEKVKYFGHELKEYEFVDDDKGGKTKTKDVLVYYEVKYNSNGTFHVSLAGDRKDDQGGNFSYERDMDPNMFMLFVASKKLDPKADKEVQAKKEAGVNDKLKPDEDSELHRRKPCFSINNIFSFFKTTGTKVKDGIKKYDEERTEELTDIVLQNGNLFTQFGRLRTPLSSRIGESFETMGTDYYTQRDSRIWKKIEKRQKIYEQDAHFPSYYYQEFNDMLTKGKVPKDIYKIPAMLLVLIKKERTPYTRSFAKYAGQGRWVEMLLGKAHQKRYMGILNDKMAEMKQNAELYGIDWTIYQNEEITRLEMKYLSDVIDDRELQIHGAEEGKKFRANKRSRKFTFTLDSTCKESFGYAAVEAKAKELDKTMKFEFATYEYNRHVNGDKHGKSIPFLKKMAEQAQNEHQREIFDMHVTAGLLSGLYLYHTDAYTKGWLKDICRVRGFVPGIWMKDINQQTKVRNLLNIFSGKQSGDNFEKETKYNLDNFTLGKGMGSIGSFSGKTFQKRWFKNGNGHKFIKFLELTGGPNRDGKDLISLTADPSLTQDERALLKEYIENSQEKSQDFDPEVRHNPSALSGTPFTKCETIVKEMMKYKNEEFDGKDSHEKGGPQDFWKNVKRDLPKGRAASEQNLIFYLSKFFNRFSACGFSEGNSRSTFIKRLRTIKRMLDSGNTNLINQGNDMLWYTINGTIIQENSAGADTPPPEFKDALEAFKNFFTANLDTILTSRVIASAIGNRYAKDGFTQTPYDIGDRSEYVEITTSNASLVGRDKEKNSEIRKKYKAGNFDIYDDLWRVAESLKDRHGEQNRFKQYYTYRGAGTTSSSSNNSETVDSLGRVVGATSRGQATRNSRQGVAATVGGDDDDDGAAVLD